MHCTLAIIGGGVAGLMACQQATLQNAFEKILWFRADPNSLGTAYDTLCCAHLLNVPAKLMGLDPNAPEGFINWLNANQAGRWQASDFVPRMQFAAYLRANIDRLDARVQPVPQRADSATITNGGWRIVAGGQTFDANAIILAPGFPLVHLNDSAAKNPSVFEAWHWFNRLAKPTDSPHWGKRILVVGSGLTAVDMVLGLRDYGYTGAIDVVSSSGRWPLPHAATEPLSSIQLASLLAQLRVCSKPAAVIVALREAATNAPWRAVLDALRPHTNDVWQSWPTALRKSIVKRAFSIWNQHRHRVPPQTLAEVLADEKTKLRRGRVSLENGNVRVNGSLQAPDQLTLFCVGARFSAGMDANPLLDQLTRAGALLANDLRMGLMANTLNRIAIIGACRFGELLETVAVPELRQQAAAAVATLVSNAGYQRRRLC